MKEDRYADIRDLPYPYPTTRPRMSREERAAQFSPFAALKGHDERIAEASEPTEIFVQSEERQELLGDEIERLAAENEPLVRAVYVHEDSSREEVLEGRLKRVDRDGKKLIFHGAEIRFSSLKELVRLPEEE